jgi:hypothetical protein
MAGGLTESDIDDKRWAEHVNTIERGKMRSAIAWRRWRSGLRWCDFDEQCGPHE